MSKKINGYSSELFLALAIFFLAFSISRSLIIAIAIATVVTAIMAISKTRNSNKKFLNLQLVIPEIIDHIISGVQSGLSLNESLMNLSDRGPIVSKEYFLEFKELIHQGESFERSINRLQDRFSIQSADQLFEALLFAKSLGGSELLSLLRQLGDFTRQDLALRNEISAKQGWIKNSAHLSAAAPWILLLLLSAQPATSAAFSTTTGVAILGVGLVLTIFAYLWMGRLSRLPEPRRIFGVTHG